MIGDGWKTTRLADLIQIKHGFAFKGEFFRDEPTPDILLTPGNFAVGGGFKDDKLKYYRGPVPDDYVLSAGDILVTMTDLSKSGDTLGYPAFVPDSNGLRYLHNQRLGKVLIMRPNLLDKQFLYYLLSSREYRHEVLASATGTTVKHTSPHRIRSFEFQLPSKQEQEAIGRTLGILDEKINSNKRLNQILEEIGRVLFERWFVDFDFPNEGGKPYKSSGGEMVDSELGKIPKGWRIGNITEIAKYVNGKAFTALATPTGRMILKIIELNSGPGSSTRYYNGRADPENIAYFDNILFSWSATLDVYRWFGTESVINQHIFKVIPNDGFPKAFVFYMLKHVMPNFQAIASGKATTMGHIQRRHLEEERIVLPPMDILIVFGGMVSPFYNLIASNAAQSNTLTKIRDTLLPKLLSGQIRVNPPKDMKCK
jgi:type I restriction enzyme S subunit